MNLRNLLLIQLLTILSATLHAQTIESIGSGHWNSDAGIVWGEGLTVGPRIGNQDSALSNTEVEIGTGHWITYDGSAPGVGGTNSGNNNTNDFAIGNGNTVTINGGVLSHTAGGNWFRIGNWGTDDVNGRNGQAVVPASGTLDIKDGAVYAPVGNVQVGVHASDAKGIIRIGDGVGEAGSALMNLHDSYSKDDLGNVILTPKNDVTELNLGSQQSGSDGGNPSKIGSVGIVIIESDGRLEGGGYKTTTASDGKKTYNLSVTRVGRYASHEESMLQIKAGGQFNAHGNVEIGSGAIVNGITAKGLIHLDGIGAQMTHDFGELTIGWTGEGRMIIENGAEFRRLASAEVGVKYNHYMGRSAAGVGTLLIRSGGKFIREGADAGDFYIGTDGIGTITIDAGGEMLNTSGNWDWIGVNEGSQGTVYVNEGGSYTSTGSVVLGRDAATETLAAGKGLFEVNGGFMDIDNFHVGQNGEGIFRLIDGVVFMDTLTMARGSGTGLFEVLGGELTIRGNFFAGGDTHRDYENNTEAGVATYRQTDGVVTSTNALAIGLNAGHTSEFEMTGGEFTHLNSDTTIGEYGTGSMYIGADARFYEDSTAPDAFMFVGRHDGSDGKLIVDGYLRKTNETAGIRVGHGSDQTGLSNNTTGRGLIGGNGTIEAPGGVFVGNYGTITAGDLNTVGVLTIDGGLNLLTSAGAPSQSTLFINFNSDSTFGADRIIINGALNVDGAVMDGTWDSRGATGVDSRYWVVVNEDNSQLSSNFFTNMLDSSSHELASYYSFYLGADGFVTFGGMEFAVFLNANYNPDAEFSLDDYLNGNDILLSAMGSIVPEPAVASLFCMGLAGLFMRRRRRHAAQA